MPHSVHFGTQISADSDLRVGGCLAFLSADPRPQLPVQRLLQQLRRRRRRRQRRSDAPEVAATAPAIIPHARDSRVADGSGRDGQFTRWKTFIMDLRRLSVQLDRYVVL